MTAAQTFMEGVKADQNGKQPHQDPAYNLDGILLTLETLKKETQAVFDRPPPKKEEPPKRFSDCMLKFPVPAKAKKDWEQLCYTLDELVVGDGYARPSEMLTSVLEGVYDDYMKASFENYDNRRQDIEQLILYSETFDDVLELLGQLSLMSSVDGEPTGSRAEPDDEKVVLSSIHQAKGLEWKVVFLIWP